MTLQSIITMAIGAELKQLAVKTDNDTVVGFVNLGLIELYKRFPLKVNETVIQVIEGQDIYTMPTDFMWLVAAYGEVEATDSVNVKVIPINEEDNEFSINTVSWNQVQIPTPNVGTYVSLIYAAAPTLLTTADLAVEVEIPVQMIEALLHYIGYRGHAAVNGEINAENSTHYTRFEKSCATIRQEGMFTGDDTNMRGRIASKGFV